MYKAAKAILSTLIFIHSSLALAYDAGDFILRAGPAAVMPNESSNDLKTVPNGRLGADEGISLGITGTYMITPNWGLGLLASYPFRHELQGRGALAGGDLAHAKHLPPTLTLQYHFLPESKFQPYVGAGINFTYFFDEEATARLNGILGSTKVDLDHSWGLGLEAGLDYQVDEHWLLNAAAWYLQIETHGTLTTAGVKRTIDVELDPWVFMLGVGRRF